MMNDKGLSLVEVLAAVVILSILFVGIMTIFPQMTLFNAKTETKLGTMNLARQEMAELIIPGNKKLDGTVRFDVQYNWSNILTTGSHDPLTQDQTSVKNAMQARQYNYIDTDTAFLRFEKNGNFRYEADVYLSCEPFKKIDLSDSGEIPCGIEDENKLFRVHLKVFDNQLLSSETFSYIHYDADLQSADESSGG